MMNPHISQNIQVDPSWVTVTLNPDRQKQQHNASDRHLYGTTLTSACEGMALCSQFIVAAYIWTAPEVSSCRTGPDWAKGCVQTFPAASELYGTGVALWWKKYSLLLNLQSINLAWWEMLKCSWSHSQEVIKGIHVQCERDCVNAHLISSNQEATRSPVNCLLSCKIEIIWPPLSLLPHWKKELAFSKTEEKRIEFSQCAAVCFKTSVFLSMKHILLLWQNSYTDYHGLSQKGSF